MAQAIRHIGNQVHVFAFRATQELIDGLDDDLDNVDVFPFIKTADVVCLGYLSVMENHVDGAGMVFDEEPVTHILALAVNRKRLLVANVVDEQRDELLGELVRTVVVGAVCHDSRHAVGVVERANEVVGTCLTGGIRAMRRVLRRFVEEVGAGGQVMLAGASGRRERGRNAFRVVHLEGTINFIGRNMIETLAFVLFREAFPVEFCSLEEA